MSEILQSIWYVLKNSGIVLIQTLGIIVIYYVWKEHYDKDKKKRKRCFSSKQRRENYFTVTFLNLIFAGLYYINLIGNNHVTVKGYLVFYICTVVPGFFATYEAHKKDRGYPSEWTDEQIEEAEWKLQSERLKREKSNSFNSFQQ